MNGSKRQGRLSRLQDRQLKIDHVKRAESSLSVAFMTAAAVCPGRTDSRRRGSQLGLWEAIAASCC
jgi:hypothetical protein